MNKDKNADRVKGPLKFAEGNRQRRLVRLVIQDTDPKTSSIICLSIAVLRLTRNFSVSARKEKIYFILANQTTFKIGNVNF